MTELCNIELIESLASALETMAFVAVMPPEGPIDPPSDPVLVRIDYRGATSGCVELIASRDLGRLLLENTLACDPSDTLVMPNPNDALVELLNITCGSLLKRIGAGRKYEMHVPQIQAVADAQQWSDFIAARADVVLADSFAVAIRNVEGQL